MRIPNHLFIKISVQVPGDLYTQLIILFLDLSISISIVTHSKIVSVVNDILLIKLQMTS